MKRGDFHGNQYQHVVSANLQTPKISQEDAAELLNVSPRLVAAVKAVERAVIAAKLANMTEGRPKTVSIDTVLQPRISLEQAADLLNVGRATVAPS
jgi:hypothetical protein